MSIIHKNYNLIFINKIWENEVSKTCDIINKNASPTYIALSTYLVYAQYPDNIVEMLLPEVINAINGASDIELPIDTIDVHVGSLQTTIEWNGFVEMIPTVDFKAILQEYADFLLTPPLDGTKV